MPQTNDPSDLRASDLLPPDDPPDGPPKRIAERRVAGWVTTNRLWLRTDRRPAGNSRRFWKKIEDDDPFIPPPSTKRIAQSTHELYPSDRLPRVESAKPKQQPSSSQPPAPQPKARAQAQPVHTRDPRAISSPTPRKPPKPAAPQTAPETTEVNRRPPRLPDPPLRRRPRGRMKASPERGVQEQVHGVAPPARSAEEIRTKKQADRAIEEPHKPPLRGIDSVLALLGELRVAETLHNQGVTGDSNTDIADEPRPKPKKMARPAPEAAAPAPTPSPPPPKPKPVAKPPAKPPVDRSPGGGGGGSLDDLFGGGPSEGRVRIGSRAKPKGKGGDSDS